MNFTETQANIRNETQIRVRYAETDQMGFVYYGNYFAFFEVGRAELMREMGLPYRGLEERGFLLPVTEADCKYKSAARYDELVSIRTAITRLTPVRIQFSYEVFGEDGRAVAFGGTSHVFTDNTGRPVNVSKKDPELWQQLIGLEN